MVSVKRPNNDSTNGPASQPASSNQPPAAPAPAELPGSYVYQGGRFVAGDPLGLDDPSSPADTMDKRLEELGYIPSQKAGDDSGLSYELYEKGGNSWVVFFSTCYHYCIIVVYTWPDLIGLLRDLSVIALAGLIRTDADDEDGRLQTAPAHLPVAPVRPYQKSRRG
jgi:hypothetical protein